MCEMYIDDIDIIMCRREIEKMDAFQALFYSLKVDD